MSTTRDVSTRLILQGEKEYRAAMQQISREYRVLESELKKVDSDFEGQRNTLAALEARHKALNDVIAQQSQRLKTEKDALENARKLQEDYARQAAAARQSLDELISSTDDAVKGTEEYKDEVARLQSEIARNETAETKCAQAVANHTVKANDAQVKLNTLNRELASNGKYLDEARNSADGCAKSIDAFGREASDAGDEASQMAQQVKAGMDALSAALASAGIAAGLDKIREAIEACIASSRDFESAMAGVAKTTDMSDGELAAMSDAFMEMSTRIPLSAKSLANIAEAAGQLGIAKEDITAFTEVMAKLGTATDMSSTEAATMLAQFSAVTGMDPGYYANLGSSIVALGNNFSTTEKKITEMAQATAGAGTNAGMSETDILALSAAVTSLGIEATTGGTNMSSLIGEMQTAVETGKDLDEWAAAAGMTATEFSALWGVDATEALRAFILGIGDTEQSMLLTLKTLGITEERTTRMITSLANAEKKNGTLTKAITLSNKAWQENNALNKEAATRYETTDSKIQLYNNSVDDLKIAVGDQLTPALGSLAETGADVVGWAADFVEQNRWLVPAITGVSTALGALTVGVVTATVVVPALKAAWTALTTALNASPWLMAASAVLGLVAALGTWATSTKSQVDELTSAAQALPEAFESANDQYAENLAQIEGTAAKADALIERLAELEAKNTSTGLDADEWREWNALLGSLVETVPELSDKINLQTGEIDGGTAALKLNTDAWKQNAIEQAKVKALQSQYDAYAATISELEENRIKLTVATKEAEDAENAYRESVQRLTEATGITEEQLNSTGDAAALLALTLAGSSAEYGPLVEEVIRLGEENREAQQNVEDLTNAVAEDEDAVASSRESLEAYNEALGALDDVSGGAAGGIGELTDAQSDQVAQFETLQQKLTELTEAYEKYYEDALKNISGVVSGFDEVTEAETKSIDESMKALDSQLAYLTDYSDNLLKLKELADEGGIALNENLVAKLSDGSVESAAILQGIVDDGGDKLADLNAKFGEVETGKNTFATIVAQMQTDFNAKTDAMVQQMRRMVDGLDQSEIASANVRKIVSDMNAALEAGIAETQGIVNRYNQALAALGRVRTAKLTSHAAGLTSVPYDDYPANLHKGERVLTALQAQALDAQSRVSVYFPAPDSRPAAPTVAVARQTDLDYRQIGMEVANALDGMSVVIDGEQAGRILATYVSEEQGSALNAGRFSL